MLSLQEFVKLKDRKVRHEFARILIKKIFCVAKSKRLVEFVQIRGERKTTWQIQIFGLVRSSIYVMKN